MFPSPNQLAKYEALAAWLKQRVPDDTIVMTDHGRCLEVLRHCAHNGQTYNLHTSRKHTDNEFRVDTIGKRRMVTIRLKSELATYDGSQLTRLVVSAHEHHVRIAISPCSMSSIEVQAVARRPYELGDYSWDFHPGLAEMTQS